MGKTTERPGRAGGAGPAGRRRRGSNPDVAGEGGFGVNRGVAERAGSRRRQKNGGGGAIRRGCGVRFLQEFRKFVWKCAAMTPLRMLRLAGPRVGRGLRPGGDHPMGRGLRPARKKTLRRGGDNRPGRNTPWRRELPSGEKSAAGGEAPAGRKPAVGAGTAGRARPDVGMEPLLREGVSGRVKVLAGELSDRRKGVCRSRF